MMMNNAEIKEKLNKIGFELLSIRDSLDHAETATKAHWVEYTESISKIYVCSNCDGASRMETNYCPYCGSRMEKN